MAESTYCKCGVFIGLGSNGPKMCPTCRAERRVNELLAQCKKLQARVAELEKERDEARTQALEWLRKALDDVIHWKPPWTLEGSVMSMFEDVGRKLEELKRPVGDEEKS